MDKKMEQQANILDSSIAKTVVYSRDHTHRPNSLPQWWPLTWRKGHPGHADEALHKWQHGALSVRGQEPGLTSQTWLNRGWQKLVLCNSQCSHSEANWHNEWQRCQLSITAKNIHVVPSVSGLCELVYELFDPPTCVYIYIYMCVCMYIYTDKNGTKSVWKNMIEE
jgi:hypothetical protein